MSGPLSFFQHGWQFVVESFAGKPASAGSAPCLLQNLEDRVLYDASPLAGLISPRANRSNSWSRWICKLRIFWIQAAHEDVASAIFADQFSEASFVVDFSQISAIETIDLQVIFVDESVEGYQSFIEDVTQHGDSDSTFQIVQLNQAEDGIVQISQVLTGGHQFSAVHIISHGSDGLLNLGSGVLSTDNLASYQSQVSSWSLGLTADADILLYGCEVAQSETGEGFVDRLSELTGADVAASDDLTGQVRLAATGSWNLSW